MELRQLRYFTVLASELSFTRAAHKLNMSQPPLSYQIASLEAELGARLFNRTSRSVELSSAGKALLPMRWRCCSALKLRVSRSPAWRRVWKGV